MKPTVMFLSLAGLAIAPLAGHSMKGLKSPIPQMQKSQKMQRLKQLGTGIQTNVTKNANSLFDKMKKTSSSFSQGTRTFVKETKEDLKSLAHDKYQQAENIGITAKVFGQALRKDPKKTLGNTAYTLRYPIFSLAALTLGHGMMADLFQGDHTAFAKTTLDNAVDNLGMGMDGLWNATGDVLRDGAKNATESLRATDFTGLAKQGQETVSNGFGLLSGFLGGAQDLAENAANLTKVNGTGN